MKIGVRSWRGPDGEETDPLSNRQTIADVRQRKIPGGLGYVALGCGEIEEMSGAGDRTRTGKLLSGGFSSHYVFRRRLPHTRQQTFVRWTMPSPSRCARGTRRLRRPPSSLYTFRAFPPASAGKKTGLARRRLGRTARRARSGVSPNLKGSAPAVSGWALNALSPLCLPISSPRQGGRDSTIAPQPDQTGANPSFAVPRPTAHSSTRHKRSR